MGYGKRESQKLVSLLKEKKELQRRLTVAFKLADALLDEIELSQLSKRIGSHQVIAKAVELRNALHSNREES